MKAVSGKDFVRMLERHDWVLMRIQGSHHIFGKSGQVVRISVPVHGNKPLKVGMIKHFLKLASLKEEDL